MSIVTELLAIKTFREGKAELSLNRQRATHREAEFTRAQAETTLDSFVEQARQRELGLYGDLCSRIVRLRDIEDVQLSMVVLKMQEREYETFLQAAEKKLTAEVDALNKRKLEHSAASRLKEKFVELVKIHTDELTRASEYKEDAEMEEAAQLQRESGDRESPRDSAQ